MDAPSPSADKKTPWKETYQRNKEAIKKRNLERYYKKTGRTFPPPPKTPPPPPPPPQTDETADRIKHLIEELRTLLPAQMKPKRVKKKKESPVSPPAPTLEPAAAEEN